MGSFKEKITQSMDDEDIARIAAARNEAADVAEGVADYHAASSRITEAAGRLVERTKPTALKVIKAAADAAIDGFIEAAEEAVSEGQEHIEEIRAEAERLREMGREEARQEVREGLFGEEKEATLLRSFPEDDGVWHDHYRTEGGDLPKYVVVSYSKRVRPEHGGETMVFPSDQHGHIIQPRELLVAYGDARESILEEAGYTVGELDRLDAIEINGKTVALDEEQGRRAAQLEGRLDRLEADPEADPGALWSAEVACARAQVEFGFTPKEVDLDLLMAEKVEDLEWARRVLDNAGIPAHGFVRELREAKREVGRYEVDPAPPYASTDPTEEAIEEAASLLEKYDCMTQRLSEYLDDLV